VAFGLVVGCGDGSTETGTETDTATGGATIATTDDGSKTDGTQTGTTDTTVGGTNTAGETEMTTAGPTTDPSTTDPSTTDPSTTDPSTTDPSTTDPSTTDPTDPSTTDPSTTDPSTTDDSETDTEGSTTGVMCGDPDFVPDPDKTYLWAANSSQGTISKIRTSDVTEVGRFYVRPDGAGSPSRTSVSLTGHVAVASRSGGVTKIWGDESLCADTNGMPGIQTSTNNQPLPWGTEECIAWHQPFNYASQRPVAWGPGEVNEETCEYENEELWTSGNNNNGGLDIMVLNGDDGSIKEMITVPSGGPNLNADFYGIYGGAVDPDGNFWGSQLGTNGKLLKVIREDMSYEIYDTPNGPHWYGMSVDNDGYVFLCTSTVGRFDPVNLVWDQANVGGYAGCMSDGQVDGLLWMSNGNGVVGVNRQTLQVEKTWNAAGSYGISVDFEGYVWAVASGSNVSKIDPENGDVTTYSGLVGAYTYSDMIGFGLAQVVVPQ